MPVCESCEDGRISQALKDQHADCLQEMLLENFEEERTKIKMTPLHAAIVESDTFDRPLEVLKFLLALPNTSVEDRDTLGRTALHYAAAIGQTEVLKALVESYSAEIHAYDLKDQTALHWAIKGWDSESDEYSEYNPSPEKVSYLLSVGCKVDERDKKWRTPLLTLLSSDRHQRTLMPEFVETANLLLDNGANINAVGDEEITPLDDAAEKCLPVLLELLFKRGGRFGYFGCMKSSLMNVPEFVKNKDLQGLDDTFRCVSIMLDHRVQLANGRMHNHEDGGCTPNVLNFLFSVAGKDYCTEECVEPLQDLVKFFADAGADSSCLHDQFTPLQYACLLPGWDWCVPSLISPASVNKKGMGGQTALHIAARKNQSEIVSLLLESKASLEAKDNLGESPLDKANKWDCRETAEILFKRKQQEMTRKRKADLRYGMSKWSRQ